ncbi:hypothetical protein [Streptomyces sp. NPDC053048]|uniref:hypothetical protein n=1 Tax=Streptomyces sp. NPDC053048 TaxID=3365694 RepID=UPI0037D7C552
MAKTALTRDAKLLALYTGLPYQQALRIAGDARRRDALIPRPSPQQELLEHGLLDRIAWPSNDPVRPWGIEYVHPQHGQLVVHFEGDHMAGELAEAFWPRADEHGEIHGIPGARFTPPTEQGITMILLGTSARVQITGIRPTAWRTALAAQEENARDYGWASCSRRSPAAWTREECVYFQGSGVRLGARSRQTAGTAWLASGLLRRVGLWRTVGVPLSTTSWTNPAGAGQQWIIDHIHEPRDLHGEHHDRFIRLLAAPGWGMPLKLDDRWCTCHQHHAEQCVMTMTGVGGLAGELQLRFPRRRGRHYWIEHELTEYEAKTRVPVLVRPWMLTALAP